MTPLFVRDTRAAKMLDIPAQEFLKLVKCGSLPSPTQIGGHARWRVSDLEAIGSGAAMNGDEFET